MSITKYLPSPQKMSQEVLATLAAIIISAWIVGQFPELKKLVRDSNT